MRVVVTGASGFIGRHLICALCCSRDVVGVARSSPRDARIIQVSDYSQTPTGDVLVHLANKGDRTIGRDEEADAVGTVRALVRKGFAKLVYVSSAAVYGDNVFRPRTPEDVVIAADGYSRMKIACESAVLERKGVVVRLANTYGEGMSGANVVSTILEQIPGTGPLQVQDDKPVRDFIWIEDVVAAIAAIIDRAHPGTYNVGTGTGISIADLARLALTAAGQGDRAVVATSPRNQRSHLVLDVARTIDQTGWRPRTTIEEGMKRLVAAKSGCRGAR